MFRNDLLMETLHTTNIANKANFLCGGNKKKEITETLNQLNDFYESHVSCIYGGINSSARRGFYEAQITLHDFETKKNTKMEPQALFTKCLELQIDPFEYIASRKEFIGFGITCVGYYQKKNFNCIQVCWNVNNRLQNQNLPTHIPKDIPMWYNDGFALRRI